MMEQSQDPAAGEGGGFRAPDTAGAGTAQLCREQQSQCTGLQPDSDCCPWRLGWLVFKPCLGAHQGHPEVPADAQRGNWSVCFHQQIKVIHTGMFVGAVSVLGPAAPVLKVVLVLLLVSW